MQEAVGNIIDENLKIPQDTAPHVIIIHHYMWPDESPTSRLFSDLAFHIAEMGCSVSVFAAKERYILNLSDLSAEETKRGVRFYRVKGGEGFHKDPAARLLAGFILMLKWLLLSFKTQRAQLLIVGTDPAFSVWLGALMKVLNRTRKLILWSMDLYPDAILAEGIAKVRDLTTRATRLVNRWALSKCDAVVDLGICMRERMQLDKSTSIRESISPWSPHETHSHERDKEIDKLRQELFGATKIGLIYSGALGRAHDISLFIRLTMEFAAFDHPISTVIASHGPNYVKIKSSIISQKIPIKCLDFVPGDSYVKRLKAADFHLVSVKPEWTGVVVPSKFFTALALGRPVIAAVDDKCSLALLCREYDLGWVLNKNNIDSVKQGLKHIAARPEKLRSWQKHVLEVYKKYFSKRAGLMKWSKLLE